jgi:hypothetical protein
MENLINQLKEYSKKYYLDFKLFQIKKKKNYFKNKKIIIYGKNEYYFEINSDKRNNYFPYFEEKQNLTDLENWILSISKTQEQHFKIVKDLDKSKEDRSDFKRKYNV